MSWSFKRPEKKDASWSQRGLLKPVAARIERTINEYGSVPTGIPWPLKLFFDKLIVGLMLTRRI
jgi:hypothetical protein